MIHLVKTNLLVIYVLVLFMKYFFYYSVIYNVNYYLVEEL
jgi:hypothetical protein